MVRLYLSNKSKTEKSSLKRVQKNSQELIGFSKKKNCLINYWVFTAIIITVPVPAVRKKIFTHFCPWASSYYEPNFAKRRNFFSSRATSKKPPQHKSRRVMKKKICQFFMFFYDKSDFGLSPKVGFLHGLIRYTVRVGDLLRSS